MINLNATVVGHSMSLANSTGGAAATLPTGSVGVDAISFTISGTDWTGTTKYAVFWQDPGAVYRVAVSDNAAAIPAEVLSSSGNVYVALYGDNGDTRISTNACAFTAEQGALTAENAPAPTPSIFEQAVAAAVAAALATIVDNTLSVSGKAADAKATGDWLRMYLTPGASYANEIAYIDALGRLAHGAFSRYVDDTLSTSGKAADAKTVGDLIRELGGGFTPEAKQNLLTLLQHVAYVDDDGQDYYDALAATLNPDATLISISAVFAQGQNVIYDTDSLDTLKQYLTVTAHYSDSTTATVSTYTLSGTLTAGSSTITVSYGGKATTFTVTVTHIISGWYYPFNGSLLSDGTEDFGLTGTAVYASGRNNKQCYSHIIPTPGDASTDTQMGLKATGLSKFPNFGGDFTAACWVKSQVNGSLHPFWAMKYAGEGLPLSYYFGSPTTHATGWTVTSQHFSNKKLSGFGLQISSGKIMFRLTNAAVTKSGFLEITPPSGFDTTNWHHYAITRKNDVIRQFVDGVLICSAPLNDNTVYAANQIAISAYFDQTSAGASNLTQASNGEYIQDLYLAEFCKWEESFDPTAIVY